MRAVSFACRAHTDHWRKDGRTPYIAHPIRVALIVRQVFGVADEVVLAAAVLHDTMEDTRTDYDDLLEAFGSEVADLVFTLTKDMRLREDVREEAYEGQLSQGTWATRLVKLADAYDNLCDAVDSDVIERVKVIPKSERVLAMAKRANDPELAEAIQAVDALLARVKAHAAAEEDTRRA